MPKEKKRKTLAGKKPVSAINQDNKAKTNKRARREPSAGTAPSVDTGASLIRENGKVSASTKPLLIDDNTRLNTLLRIATEIELNDQQEYKLMHTIKNLADLPGIPATSYLRHFFLHDQPAMILEVLRPLTFHLEKNTAQANWELLEKFDCPKLILLMLLEGKQKNIYNIYAIMLVCLFTIKDPHANNLCKLFIYHVEHTSDFKTNLEFFEALLYIFKCRLKFELPPEYQHLQLSNEHRELIVSKMTERLHSLLETGQHTQEQVVTFFKGFLALLSRNYPLSYKNDANQLVIEALKKGYALPIVELLIPFGNIHKANDASQSPLLIALENNNLEALALLKKNRVDLLKLVIWNKELQRFVLVPTLSYIKLRGMRAEIVAYIENDVVTNKTTNAATEKSQFVLTYFLQKLQEHSRQELTKTCFLEAIENGESYLIDTILNLLGMEALLRTLAPIEMMLLFKELNGAACLSRLIEIEPGRVSRLIRLFYNMEKSSNIIYELTAAVIEQDLAIDNLRKLLQKFFTCITNELNIHFNEEQRRQLLLKIITKNHSAGELDCLTELVSLFNEFYPPTPCSEANEAILIALERNYPLELISQLLPEGDLNVISKAGKLPLLVTLEKNNTPALRVLFAAGADPGIPLIFLAPDGSTKISNIKGYATAVFERNHHISSSTQLDNSDILAMLTNQPVIEMPSLLIVRWPHRPVQPQLSRHRAGLFASQNSGTSGSQTKLSPQQAVMTISSQKMPTFSHNPPAIKPRVYNPHSATDRKQLVENQGNTFSYIKKKDRDGIKKVSVRIGPVHLINGLGVYAEKEISKSISTTPVLIGEYRGERVARNKEDPNSLYHFNLFDRKRSRVIGGIDANHQRNWCAFVNHSHTPNLEVIQMWDGKETYIGFFPCKDIKKGEQLFIDYGYKYFHHLPEAIRFSPLYLHSSDNWKSETELFLDNKAFYHPLVVHFDAQMVERLKLKTNTWIVPKLFIFILNNELSKLSQELEQLEHVDLYALALQENKLAAQAQEHLTALMFAAYLGRTDCINLLLQAKADADRRMLRTGYNAFHILLLGFASHKQVATIGKNLLAEMHDHFYSDNNGLTLLNHLVKENNIRGLELVLNYALQEKIELTEYLFAPVMAGEKELDLFDYCIATKSFTILCTLIEKVFSSQNTFLASLKNLMKKNSLFEAALLQSLSKEELTNLKEVLIQTLPKSFVNKPSKLLNSLNQIIKNKIAEEANEEEEKEMTISPGF